MLIGFLLCAVGFLTMGASKLGNGIEIIDGTLYVKGLLVVEDINKPYEGRRVSIVPSGIGVDGGENSSRLFASSLTLSRNDKTTVELLTLDNATGLITIYNKFGNEAASLATTKDDDGGVFLYDRYGDFGHSLTGKK